MYMESNIRNLSYSANEGLTVVQGEPREIYYYDFDIVLDNDVALHPLLIALTHTLILGDDINSVNTQEQKKTLSEEQFNELVCAQQLSHCSICMENKKLNIKLKCNHTFCKPCIKKWLTEKSNTCPTCRIEI